MVKNSLCVIIPIYKKQLELDEEFSVDRTVEVLKERTIFFIAPLGMEYSYYQKRYPEVKCVFFNKKYFKNVSSYSKLLLSRCFYDKFLNFDYMLIAQTDAIILSSKDLLDMFVRLEYDYIGAPWKKSEKLYPMVFKGSTHLKNVLKPVESRVGNGGFCLRKIKTMVEILNAHPLAIGISKLYKKANEDGVLCYYLKVNNRYSLPTVDMAETFSVEETAKVVLEKGIRPFAVHGYKKYVGSSDIIIKYME